MSDDPKDGAAVDADLLEILVCPESKAKLVLDAESLVSTDPDTRRRYRIEEGIPRMLIEESEQLDTAAWKDVMRRCGREDLAG